MSPQQVIERFGGTQASTAQALGLSRAAICKWVKTGRVPELWQYRIAGMKQPRRDRMAA
jgi:predicted transcriptional regulator